METNRDDVIIDTDIGNDIDDAVAICLAMKSPEINILGVTTVFNDTVRRARMAARLLRLGGMGHVPVYAGRAKPQRNTRIYGKDIPFGSPPPLYTEEYDQETYNAEMSACDFIIQTLENAPKPIVIITLGALSNIADVVTRRPDLLPKIKRISMMGGAFIFRNVSEYNFSCDPEAAETVIQSGVPITCVGLDVTFRCILSGDQVARLRRHKHPCMQMLMEMQRLWSHDIVLHDPLAVAVAFDRSLITTEKIVCHVELDGTYTRGSSVNLSDFTWALPGNGSNLDIAVDVDSQRVVSLCMERLLSYEEPDPQDNAVSPCLCTSGTV